MLRKSLYAFDGPLRKRGRPKKIWMEVVRIDLKKYNLSKDFANERLEWKNRIHIANLKIVRTKL